MHAGASVHSVARKNTYEYCHWGVGTHFSLLRARSPRGSGGCHLLRVSFDLCVCGQSAKLWRLWFKSILMFLRVQ